MPTSPIAAGEVDVNSPLNTTLFEKIRSTVNANQVFSTLAEMTAVDSDLWVDSNTALTLGEASRGDGYEGRWYWDSSSTASASNNVVIPDDAPSSGRFIRMSGRLAPSIIATDAGQDFGSSLADLTWDTEVADAESDFASPTYTAPAPGIYRISMCLRCSSGMTQNDSFIVTLATSNRDFDFIYTHLGSTRNQSISYSTLADLDLGDTAKWTVVRTTGSGNFITSGSNTYNSLSIEYVSPI